MSLVIMFYFTSSMLNMFRTLIHPSSGACDFSVVSPHWSCVLVSMCVGFLVWLGWSGIRVAGWSTRIPPQPSHTETPTLTETRTHDQCGDTTEKSQAPDDGCINVRNMLCFSLLQSLILQQLCQLRCFNDYTRQLHVSAPSDHLQVVFKRT